MLFFSPLVALCLTVLQLLAVVTTQGRILLYTQPNCQGDAVHLPCVVSFDGEHKCAHGYFKSFHVPHLSIDQNDPKYSLPRLHAMFVWPNSRTCCLPDSGTIDGDALEDMAVQCHQKKPKNYFVDTDDLKDFERPGCHSTSLAFGITSGSLMAMECFA